MLIRFSRLAPYKQIPRFFLDIHAQYAFKINACRRRESITPLTFLPVKFQHEGSEAGEPASLHRLRAETGTEAEQKLRRPGSGQGVLSPPSDHVTLTNALFRLKQNPPLFTYRTLSPRIFETVPDAFLPSFLRRKTDISRQNSLQLRTSC